MLGVMRIVVFVLVSGALIVSSVVPVSARDVQFCEHNYVLMSCEETCTTSSTSAASKSVKPVTTGDGGGCGGSVEDNKNQIWGFLKSKGLSDEAAAGIMGNMEQESGFSPGADNGKTMGFNDNSGRGCRGIVQWCHERNNKLDSFAAERGKNWDCLGVQLEYMWYELTETGESAVMKDLTAATTARDAGNIFAEQYERMKPSELVGRDNRAEKIFEEFTGKPGSTTGTNSKSSKDNCPSSGKNTPGGPILSADCKETVAKMNELKDTRIYHEGDWVQKDIDRCTPEKIERCGADGGVNPQVLRGIVAMSENAGVDSVMVWNINSIHGCDEFDHPVGLATDIGECGGQAATNDSEECRKVFDYLIANKDELGIKYIIWNGSYCESKETGYSGGVMCNGDHNDHIHVSFNG